MKIFGLCQSLLLFVGCQSFDPVRVQSASETQQSKLQNVSTTNATVWMPMAWSPKISSEITSVATKSSLESLQLKDVKILFRNLQNNAQHYVPLNLGGVALIHANY